MILSKGMQIKKLEHTVVSCDRPASSHSIAWQVFPDSSGVT